MNHVILFIFLFIFLSGLTACFFSVYFLLKTGSRAYRYFVFFFFILSFKTLLNFCLFYFKVNVFFETTVQIVIYTVSTDLTYLITFLFPFLIQSLLEHPFKKTGKILAWSILLFAFCLRVVPYLIKLSVKKDYFYFDSYVFQEFLAGAVYLYAIVIGLLFFKRIKDRSLRKIFLITLFFYTFILLDLYWISWSFYLWSETSPLVLLDLLFYAGWTLFFIVYSLGKEIRPAVNLMNESLSDRFSQKYELSSREREMADMIVAGKVNQEIADHYFISVKTVKNHITKIYQKTGVNNRIELAMMVKKEN